MRVAARIDVTQPGGTAEPTMGRRRGPVAEPSRLRPEARHEDPSHAARTRPETGGGPVGGRGGASGGEPGASRPAATGPRRRETTWSEPDVPRSKPDYAVYRPDSAKTAPQPRTPRIRSEAR